MKERLNASERRVDELEEEAVKQSNALEASEQRAADAERAAADAVGTFNKSECALRPCLSDDLLTQLARARQACWRRWGAWSARCAT